MSHSATPIRWALPLAVACVIAVAGVLLVEDARSAGGSDDADWFPEVEDEGLPPMAFDTDVGEIDTDDTDLGEDTDLVDDTDVDTDPDTEDTTPPTAAEIAGETGGVHCSSAAAGLGLMPLLGALALLLARRRSR